MHGLGAPLIVHTSPGCRSTNVYENPPSDSAANPLPTSPTQEVCVPPPRELNDTTTAI